MESDYLLDKKVEYLIGMHVNVLKHDLEHAKGAIMSLSEEIETLKKKVHRLNISESQGGVGQSESSVPRQAAPAQRTTSAEARSGQYKSADVSVEKMFYFGKR